MINYEWVSRSLIKLLNWFLWINLSIYRHIYFYYNYRTLRPTTQEKIFDRQVGPWIFGPLPFSLWEIRWFTFHQSNRYRQLSTEPLRPGNNTKTNQARPHLGPRWNVKAGSSPPPSHASPRGTLRFEKSWWSW